MAQPFPEFGFVGHKLLRDNLLATVALLKRWAIRLAM